MIITEFNEQIEQPNFFGKIQLFPFQLASVYAMEELEKKKFSCTDRGGSIVYDGMTDIGILGNKVGSGKTNILLTVAKRNKTKFASDTFTKISVQTFCDSRINVIANFTSGINPFLHLNTTLVVVPHTIFIQWITEMNKTSVRYLKVDKPEDFEIPYSLENFDLIICVATKFTKFYNKFQNIIWNRVIFDEVDSIKGIKELPKSNFMWLVSATYPNLADSNTLPSQAFSSLGLGEFIIDKILIDCDEDYINNYLNFTNIERHYIKCFLDKKFQMLRDFITPEIQNMINGDDVDGVVKALGGSSETEDAIVDALSTKIKNDMEDSVAKIEYILTIHSMSASNKERNIKKEQEKIASLQEKLQSLEDNTPIAIIKSKEDVCMDIILKNPQKKFLVFSDYAQTFQKLKYSLSNKNIGHSEVKGDINSIDRIIRKYNKGQYNVLLLDSKYAGAGLNLELTTDIVIYHNTKLETQIIGRALRASRDPKIKLDIHYLQYENELNKVQ